MRPTQIDVNLHIFDELPEAERLRGMDTAVIHVLGATLYFRNRSHAQMWLQSAFDAVTALGADEVAKCA